MGETTKHHVNRSHEEQHPVEPTECRITDGIKLPPDDEKFIVTNVLMYHPERKKKIAGNGNYITVDRHQVFHGSRCLYVMSSDGSRKDFSYKKCLENYIRAQYPDAADSFCRKYFK
uniref:DNA-directed RNA polymerase subunit n=1 Tax=Oryza glumipatula TaxID=40148 RepID=A0A0D9YKG5_9ORYZ